MPTRLLTVLLLALVLLAPDPSYADEVAPDRAERIDRYLDDYAEQNHLPGLAVAVLDADGVQHEYLHGEDGDDREITADSTFLIGSLAKTMTATVVMQLRDEGKLAFDDHVSDHIDYLPEGDPTIEQLLTHTAGFTGADGIAVADRGDNEPGAIRRSVEDLEQSGTVGDYAYTSADFLVLGAVVEAITGRPYGEVVESRLLAPLKLSDSASSADAVVDLPPGHRLWFGRPFAFDPGFDESGTPYASITMTLADLERYARAQLGLDDALPAALRKTMQRPWVESSQDHYGLGWSITEQDGKRVVHHTGATPGYFAHLLMVPEDGVAVVLLANAYAESRAPSLAAGAEDVWRITAGQQRKPAGGDPMLSALPWLLAGLALLAMLLVVVSRRRPVRRTPRILVAGGCLLAVATLWMLPGLFGQDLRALRIWLPDAGWSLIVAMVVWALACVAFLLPTRRSLTAAVVESSRVDPKTGRVVTR